MMERPLIVAFQTCDRPEYTAQTLASFSRFHPSGWVQYYADDCSVDRGAMYRLVEGYGFTPLVLHSKRAGISRTASELIEQVAVRHPQGTVLYLQNDFEFLRAIPLDVADKVFLDPKIGWLRLAGKWKYPGRELMPEDWVQHLMPPCWNWKTISYDGEEVEIGRSYFCHNPPCLTPVARFKTIVFGTTWEIGAAENAAKLPFLTARFKMNVTRHIGFEPTKNKIAT